MVGHIGIPELSSIAIIVKIHTRYSLKSFFEVAANRNNNVNRIEIIRDICKVVFLNCVSVMGFIFSLADTNFFLSFLVQSMIVSALILLVLISFSIISLGIPKKSVSLLYLSPK